MIILDEIPLELDVDLLKKILRINKTKATGIDIREIQEIAEALIKGRAAYTVSYIGKREGDTVEIEGVSFKSRVLSRNLKKTERVFPFIITIGNALEQRASSSENLLEQFYLETIGDMALDSVMDHLRDHLKMKFGLEKLANMSPGSLEDWPITEQKSLFTLFQDKKKLGVELSELMLMIPRKSISGIYFPTEVTFLSCQLCSRQRCSSRKAAYDEKIKKKYEKP
jgi:hypothetical protein